MIDRKKFFDYLRESLFRGKITPSQVEGMTAILDYWESNALNTDLRQLAYILGTVFHETKRTMQPIEEDGKGAGRRYGRRVKYNGLPYQEDHIYYGRGHTQNTWWDIYKKLTLANDQGWDFVNHPELLLQMEPSVWATFYAMGNGLYTGKKLSHYFNSNINDPLNARRVVNGTRPGEKYPDRAQDIAEYSRQFLVALV